MNEAQHSPDDAEAGKPRVDFYLLADAAAEGSLRLACRLVEKAYGAGHRVHIHADSQHQARRLDALLWTFRAGSFLPHSLLSEGAAEDYPIRIGWDPADVPSGDVLVTLASQVPPFYERFRRVVEVVGPGEAERLAARGRYRAYRDRGRTPHSHRLSSAAVAT